MNHNSVLVRWLSLGPRASGSSLQETIEALATLSAAPPFLSVLQAEFSDNDSQQLAEVRVRVFDRESGLL